MSAVLKSPQIEMRAGNSTSVIQEFKLLTDAPQGINRLRELVVALAMRGKLVPQDSNERSADLLVQRLQLVSQSRVRIGRDKRARSVQTCEDSDSHLPRSWRCVALGSALEMTNGRAFKPSDWLPMGVPIVRIQNLNDEAAPFNYCDPESLDARHKIDSGDFLISWSGTPGTSFGAFIWDRGPAALNQHIFKCELLGEVFIPEFLRLAINSKLGTLILRAQGGVGLKHVTKGTLENLLLPLPSLDEQRRIVNCVEQLMRLCDALEAKGRLEAEQHDRLLSSLLGALTDSRTHEELTANWQRIAAHLDLLVDRPEAIDALERSILQLGIHGRLVNADQKAEPAACLLSRMQRGRTSRRSLVGANDETIAATDYVLPEGWCWASADELSADSENAICDGPFGANLKTEHYVDTPGFRVIRLQNIGFGTFRDEHRAYVDEQRFLALQKHEAMGGDIVVAGLVDDSIRCCIVPKDIGPAIVKADCYRFAVHEEVSAEYVCLYLCSDLAHEFASPHHHGLTLTRIGLGNFRSIPVPLPPFEEQRRIVARVVQLRRLCADLREKLTAARAVQTRLADALVEQAVARRN